MEIPLKKHKLGRAAKDDDGIRKRRRKKYIYFSEFNVLNDFVIYFFSHLRFHHHCRC